MPAPEEAPPRSGERQVDDLAPPADAGEQAATAAAGAPAPLTPSATTLEGAGASGRADGLFQRLTTGAAIFAFLLIVSIALFLTVRAVDALAANSVNFLTYREWFPNSTPPAFGVLAIAWGTLLTSVLALAMAVPVAVGVALFISHYAPRRLARVLGGLVDLLAAVPSVVFGLWGAQFLFQPVADLSATLERWLGWIPIFSTESGMGPYGRSVFLASIVLAIMVLPITAAISREVFLQTPRDHEEAALALGATRWEMVRTAVLPYARPGVIGASMLGLGRALGETIAVALVLSTNYEIVWRILEPGGNTIAANIALQFPEANAIGRGALIASGLALFLITLAVNFAARAVVARRREFSGTAS